MYTPQLSSSSNANPLPVLFFVHGGSFAEGSNQGPLDLYDGTNLAGAHNAVVVTANYRLSVFGYLVTESLNGNYGLMDQRAALVWIQKNIALFGGDPTRVTLWG